LVFNYACLRILVEFHPTPPHAGRSCGSHRFKDGPRHEQLSWGPGDLSTIHGTVRHQQIITVMVLAANFIIEMVYGLIDPRIKAAQAD
jgi:hypothetical protein